MCEYGFCVRAKPRVKVAPASSCVPGRIDHLIQIKDGSARGRDELGAQCKIETHTAAARLWRQGLLRCNICSHFYYPLFTLSLNFVRETVRQNRTMALSL